MTQRMAGDPGLVGRVVGFLRENPLTESWRGSVGGGINAMERALTSDAGLRMQLANIAEKQVVNGEIGDETIRLLEQIKGADIDQANLRALAQQHEAGVADYVGNLANAYALDSKLGRGDILRYLSDVQGPLNQRGDLAHGAALLATHPAVAYSAVTAGGALGTAGLIEAYDWYLAQQAEQAKAAKREAKASKEVIGKQETAPGEPRAA